VAAAAAAALRRGAGALRLVRIRTRSQSYPAAHNLRDPPGDEALILLRGSVSQFALPVGLTVGKGAGPGQRRAVKIFTSLPTFFPGFPEKDHMAEPVRIELNAISLIAIQTSESMKARFPTLRQLGMAIQSKLPSTAVVFGFIALRQPDPSHSTTFSNGIDKENNQVGNAAVHGRHSSTTDGVQDRDIVSSDQNFRWAECCSEISNAIESNKTEVGFRLQSRHLSGAKRSRTSCRNEVPRFELVSEMDDGESSVVSVIAFGELCKNAAANDECGRADGGTACISLVRQGLLRLHVVEVDSSDPPSIITAAVWTGPVEDEIVPEELDSDTLSFRFALSPRPSNLKGVHPFVTRELAAVCTAVSSAPSPLPLPTITADHPPLIDATQHH
jgi:hypothetical protein